MCLNFVFTFQSHYWNIKRLFYFSFRFLDLDTVKSLYLKWPCGLKVFFCFFSELVDDCCGGEGDNQRIGKYACRFKLILIHFLYFFNVSSELGLVDLLKLHLVCLMAALETADNQPKVLLWKLKRPSNLFLAFF